MQITFRSFSWLMLASVGGLHAQLSSSAYRVLGQPDMVQNGLNMVQGLEFYAPSGVALDARGGQVHVYISDTRNSRVLAWPDTSSYQNGDPPALILGQPNAQSVSAYGIGVKGFNVPLGLAADPNTGNLYVADFGDNRVLRFPAPFSNPSRVEPDAVYGQPDFNSRTANPSAITSSSMNGPRGVAFDLAGNLWVADGGNHRILRFNSTQLDNPTPPAADFVVGQKDFSSGSANHGGNTVSASGFDMPSALVFDRQNNLYVADLNNTRVLRFSAPLGPTNPNPSATAVWGEGDFTSHGVPAQASASTLAGPTGVAVDNTSLYVSVSHDNRVLIFPLASTTSANSVLGQSDFSSTAANSGSAPQASQNSLAGPADVKVDPNGNVLVADAGNNRVLMFPSASKSASRVWGQSDFVGSGPNQIKPGSISAPFAIAVDYSQTPYPLYVSDRGNNRVLVWRDSVHFRNGDPADLVIGQPDLRTAIANVDTKGSPTPSRTSLAGPAGLVADPRTGVLYVADSANNRVLRYPRPVDQAGRITPDVVIGQSDFTSSASAAVSNASLRAPAGLALGPDGNLFVADAGNNRVLEFAAGSGTRAAAIRVYGQPNFSSAIRPGQVSAQTLSAPQGVFVDASFNLYVADFVANRVLVFPNTQGAPPAGMAASFVIGQGAFDGTGAAGTSLKGPVSVATDSSGNIYVTDSSGNRVLIFPSLVFLPAGGAVATGVVGQPNATGTAANWDSSSGQATAEGLYGPLGMFLDRQDTLYVGDAGNNRVVHFLKSAAVVNAATYQAGVPVAQGGLAAMFGSGLAAGSATQNGAPWPAILMQRQIVFNDSIPAPIYFMSPTQANFQVPSLAPLGTDRIAVRLSDTGELVAGGSLIVSSASPGLFTASQDGRGQAAARNQDNSLNSSSNPALKGSTISLYGTGQGQVSPPVPDGTAAPSLPLSNTVAVATSDSKSCATTQPSMCVLMGSSFGAIQFSGLAPGFIGLWQINVQIPQDVTAGNVPVRVLINGTPSNAVTVAVR